MTVQPSLKLAIFSAVTAFLFLLPAPGGAASYTVHPDGTGDFPDIRTAVAAAVDGDEILLANGVFQGAGNRDILVISNITIRSETGDPRTCVIDCESNGNGFTIGSNPTVEGITIRNGDEARGGGITCHGAPVLRDLIIEDCRAFTGGGIYIEDFSAPIVEDCVFQNNFVNSYGGAIYCYFSDASFLRCSFVGNEALEGGGGVVCGGNETFTDCFFAENRGGYYANGLTSFWSARVVRCTFWRNEAGGIRGGSSLVIENTIIAESHGPAITCGGALAVVCTNAFDNSGGDWVECAAGFEGLEGNFSADPLFCDAAGGDFRLASGSPCVPGHHPDGTDCGWIGAFRECQPTPVRPATWGQLKHRFSSGPANVP